MHYNGLLVLLHHQQKIYLSLQFLFDYVRLFFLRDSKVYEPRFSTCTDDYAKKDKTITYYVVHLGYGTVPGKKIKGNVSVTVNHISVFIKIGVIAFVRFHVN